MTFIYCFQIHKSLALSQNSSILDTIQSQFFLASRIFVPIVWKFKLCLHLSFCEKLARPPHVYWWSNTFLKYRFKYVLQHSQWVHTYQENDFGLNFGSNTDINSLKGSTLVSKISPRFALWEHRITLKVTVVVKIETFS